MHSITRSEFNKKYTVLQKIGEGSFGKVFKIENNYSGEQLALKKITLQKDEKISQFMRQIQIQSFLAHPKVLKIFEFYVIEAQHQYYRNKTEVGIVMELGTKSLMEIIKDKSQDFPIEQIINFSFEFVKMFAFFQDQSIVHRDIKPENFVLFQKGLQCKLIDFGLCTHINDIRNVAGSLYYLSPKLKKLHYNRHLHIKTNPYKDDVYSFGLTLYELITRRTGQTQLHRVSSDIYDWTKNQELADIVEWMLEYDEEKRPDFKQLYQLFNKRFTFFTEEYKEASQVSIDMKSNTKISIERKSPPKPCHVSQFNCQLQNQHSMHSRTNKIEEMDNSQKKFFDICKTFKNQLQQQLLYSKKTYQLGQHIKITSIIKMKQIIVCGCLNGLIYVINTASRHKKQIYQLRGMNNNHKKMISSMEKDKLGRLWTTSTDGKVLIWDRTKFYQHLLNQSYYKQKQIRRVNVLGQKDVNKQYFVEMDPQVCTQIKVSYNHPSGVSSLYCVDSEHYIVGFYDGCVYLVWNNVEYHYFGHTMPVTSIRVYHNKLYTSGIDGCIKIFSLYGLALQNRFFQCKEPICNFDVYGSPDKPNFSIFTTNGKNYIVKFDEFQISQKKYKNQLIVDALAAVFVNQGAFSLASNGMLIRNGQVMQNNIGNGWNCLADDGDRGIVMGSLQGKLAVITWNR